MQRDEIIEMAKEAGFWQDLSVYEGLGEHFKAFANLVAAKERKEICGVVQQIVPITNWAHELLDAIRARGEA